MITVSDLIEGAETSITATGATATRVFIVSTDGYESPFSLVDADGIPPIDEPHPEGYLQALGLAVGEKTIEALDPLTFRVTVRYSRDPYSAVTINSTVVTSQSNREPGNGPGTLGEMYKPLESKSDKSRGKYTPTVSKMVPSLTAEISQKISGFPAIMSKTESYIGKVNDGTFLGGDNGQWFCSDVSAESMDGGRTWLARFGFLYSDQVGKTEIGHNAQEFVYNAPGTNNPIANASVDDGNIKQDIMVYQYAQFSFPGVT